MLLVLVIDQTPPTLDRDTMYDLVVQGWDHVLGDMQQRYEDDY